MNEQVESKQQIVPEKKSKLWLWAVLVILVVAAAVMVIASLKSKSDDVAVIDNQIATVSTAQEAKTWQEGGVAIAGKYADAEVVDLGDGQYRMYYAAEPEIQGFNAQLYSAISSDGLAWTEEGEFRQGATFPDVVKLSDGRFRMYFQNSQVIKSAISSDGLNWTDETGTRVDKAEDGFPQLHSVGAPTTVQLDDGSYLMVYAATIENEKYNANVPNNKIQFFFYAVSTDGLTWQKKGMAFDSRNETLEGLADGPEFAKWSDGALRLYFWSYRGIYYSTYGSGSFDSPVLTFRGPNIDESKMYSPNPPSDPTLIKIKDIWYMYYGQHEKGIYFATLSN